MTKQRIEEGEITPEVVEIAVSAFRAFPFEPFDGDREGFADILQEIFEYLGRQ